MFVVHVVKYVLKYLAHVVYNHTSMSAYPDGRLGRVDNSKNFAFYGRWCGGRELETLMEG